VNRRISFVFETPRLIFREFKISDVDTLAPILADPEVMRYSPTGPLTKRQTHKRIEEFIKSYRENGFGKWAVIIKEESNLVGYCGIALEVVNDKPVREMGYRFDRRYWGQGLATEAAAATRDYVFRRLKFQSLTGFVELGNKASIRVLEKIGMQYVGRAIFLNKNVFVYRQYYETCPIDLKNSPFTNYTKNIPSPRLERFLRLKESFVKSVKGVSVTMKYKMPTFEKNGNWVCLGNQKNYISVYFRSEELIKAIKRKYPEISTGKGCVRIKDNEEVPISELVKSFRLALSRKNDKLKRKRTERK
jgi:RimJ/RimL family protein N-acetyltransferase/uncharacterized protein YdhG (YjbR/CyaY superfamily)